MICPGCGNSNIKRIYIFKNENQNRQCLDCKKCWQPKDDIDESKHIKKGSYKEHQEILEAMALICQSTWPECFVCERHVGLFYTKRGSKIQIGLPGQADTYLLLPCCINNLFFHIHVEIEIKSGNAVLSPDQKRWKKQIISKGGLYITIRKPEDIVSIIEKKYGSIICKNFAPIN